MEISPVSSSLKQSLLVHNFRTGEGLPWAPYIPWPAHELRKVHRATTLEHEVDGYPERISPVGENAGMSKKDRRKYRRRRR